MAIVPELPTTTDGRVDELFGVDTFSKQVMQKRLPKAVYKSLLRTIDHGGGIL